MSRSDSTGCRLAILIEGHASLICVETLFIYHVLRQFLLAGHVSETWCRLYDVHLFLCPVYKTPFHLMRLN